MKTFKRIGLVALFAAAVLAVLSFFPWGPVKVVRVVGESMEPTLWEGDWLLCERRSWGVGDIVVARDEEGVIVKRVQWVGAYGRPMSVNGVMVPQPGKRCYLVGDNGDITDRRRVFADQVWGKVVRVF